MRETMLTITGNLTEDPRLQLTATGVRVARFTVATNERRYDKKIGAWRDLPPMFWSVSCWRNMGENAVDSLKKGDPVVVYGKVYASEYTNEQGFRTRSFKLDAQAVGHDLTWGVARFTRASSNRDELEDFVDLETGEITGDLPDEPERETDAA